MPIPSDVPRPLDPGAPAWGADNDDELAPEEEPKPLHTSAVAARTEGDARPAAAWPLGATELANTACPRLETTPAVAPRARAANCDEDAEDPLAPAPLRAPLLLDLRVPLLAPLDELLECAAPDADTLLTEALPEDEDAAEPDADEPLEAEPVPEVAALAPAAPPGVPALLPPPLRGAPEDD